MSCVDTGPFDGGTYNSPIINDPTVTGGAATNLNLDNPKITGTVTMDAAAASSVFAAMQESTPAQALDEPAATEGTDLPVKIVGEDRSVLLGKPVAFIKFGSYMVPAYRAG